MFRCAALVGVACATVACRADVILDNIDEPTSAVTVLGTTGQNDIWAAQQFRVRGIYSLESIDVRAGNAIDPTDIVMQLRAGPDPSGPVVATLIVPPLSPNTVDVVSLRPTGPVELVRGVSYWLVAGVSMSGEFGLAYALGNNWSGSAVFGRYEYSSDRGETWDRAGTDDPYHLRIVATPTCACPADFNCDGQSDFFDYLDFAAAFSAEDPAADYGPDGQIDFFDYLDFATAFDIGC